MPAEKKEGHGGEVEYVWKQGMESAEEIPSKILPLTILFLCRRWFSAQVKRADPSHVFREAKGCFQSYENICACSFSKEPGKARARSIQGKPVRISGNLREYKSLKELENINAASCAENFSAITPFLISIAQIRRERPRLCFTQSRGLPRIGRIISFDLLWMWAEIPRKAKARSAIWLQPLA